MIYDDFERESQKDLVYLLEARAILQKEYWEWYDLVHRKPAQITVINESKILQNESKKSDILPF